MTDTPLRLPHGLSAATINPVTVAGVARSPFTGAAQVQVHQGEYWAGQISFPARAPQKVARAISAWLTALRGPVGSFWMGDPMAPLPAVNEHVCSPTIGEAASARARVIKTQGWRSTDGISADTLKVKADSTRITADRTAVALRAGDYVQLGERLHKVLGDAAITDQATGAATLSVWPALREAAIPGAAVTYRYPVGKFALVPSASYGWSSVGQTRQQLTQLSIQEDLR